METFGRSSIKHMAHLEVKRLAAADMWGTAGSPRRRRIIRAEFFVGALGCTALGVLVILAGRGWWLANGALLLGIGANYVPLALSAQSLSRPGALEREVAGLDRRGELRRASVQQLWILVPGALVVAALVRAVTRRD
jgi:hypothetical protein